MYSAASGVDRVNRHCTCFLFARFEAGGLERVQMNIAAGLVKTGIPIELITRSVSDQAKTLLMPEVPVQALGGNRLLFMYRLAKWLRHAEPEVVITSANDIGCFVLLLRHLLWRKTKVIWTQHLSISGPLHKSKGLKRVRLLLEIWSMRRLAKYADAVVAVSKSVADDMKHLLTPELSILVINNPAISGDFDSRSREDVAWPWENKDVPTIVFVGRLAPVKRIDLLLRAFALCVQTTSARLLVVGDGLEAASAAQLAMDLRLGPACVFLGHRSNPLPWIRGSDLLVLCSDSEGFGLVLVEAMACGTQVVATDCPCGPAEVLGGGKFGYLVPVGDAKALADAIQQSLKYPRATEDALIERASEFGVEGSVVQYEKLLNTMVRR